MPKLSKSSISITKLSKKNQVNNYSAERETTNVVEKSGINEHVNNLGLRNSIVQKLKVEKFYDDDDDDLPQLF
jgi:hypothetical protein